VLDDLGFAVSSFNNGNEFTEIYKKVRFDVVIISWDICPNLGGMVVESIRHRGEPYPALIVACDGGESVSFQLALSPVGFLFKPYDAKQLMEILCKAVGG
jgi:DNA-binding NtrC family response regulator